MVYKVNCWEAKNCGREVGGSNVAELGVCPAATDRSSDGINGGINAGRRCWALAGTLCGGEVQGEFAKKQFTCVTCDFFKRVEAEEKSTGSFRLLKPGQAYNLGPSSLARPKPSNGPQ